MRVLHELNVKACKGLGFELHYIESGLSARSGAELPPDSGPPNQGISPVVLERGMPLTGLFGGEDSISYFVLRIPESVKDISFAISGGSGNAAPGER